MSRLPSYSRLLILLLLVWLSKATAQTVVTTGAVRGTVSDASGSVIPGARIELSEERTGTTQKRFSGHEGSFFFPAVAVGKYSIKVTLEGFRPTERTEVIVSVGETTTADVTLQPGATTESVTVVGTTPMLRTND